MISHSVIRTSYLTPFKIIILILIHKFCHYELPAAVNPKLVGFILDSIEVSYLFFFNSLIVMIILIYSFFKSINTYIYIYIYI